MQTTAEMISEVIASLGDPPQDWLSPREVARILRNRLSLALTRLNQSDQNHTETMTEFVVVNREADLSVIGNGEPDWAEVSIQTNQFDGYSSWQYVPTVNLDSLEEFRREEKQACSFYRDGNGLLKIRTSGAGGYYAVPNGERWRVWYAPQSSVLGDLDKKSALPPNFNFLITDGTIVDSVGFLLNNAARDTQNPPTELQLSAWREMQSSAGNRLIGWAEAFNEYKNRSKQRGRNRRNVLRGAYDWRRF